MTIKEYLIIGFCIALLFTIVIGAYKLKKDKTIRGSATLTDNHTVSFFGKEYDACIDNTKWQKGNKVYTKYYGELRAMIIIMYEPFIGYVLTPEDRDINKFYLIDEVFIAKIGDKVTGYLKDDVFWVTGTVD